MTVAVPNKTFRISSKPGVKRDSTLFQGSQWSDSQWVRFGPNGLPRSIPGYKRIATGLDGPIRGAMVHSNTGITRFYSGSYNGLQATDMYTQDQSLIATLTRTPLAYASNPDNMWSLDELFDGGGNTSTLLAHVAPNFSHIDNEIPGVLYIGDIDANIPLVLPTVPPTYPDSGGILSAPPYAFLYGADGLVQWCTPNDPKDWTVGLAKGGFNRVTQQKIVSAMQVRGGAGVNPSALFWSLDALIRMTFVGGTALFDFDTVTSDSSVLSSNGFVEYDGVYFWPAVDRFLMYTGVVKEVPNLYNNDYLFENVNMKYRQAVWATKVPRFGEIWFFVPLGSAQEANHAIIYNTRLNVWYDTPIDRSAGDSPQVFPKPLWAQNTAGNKADLWMHETGTDAVAGAQALAIQSFIETANISLIAEGPEGEGNWSGQDSNLITLYLEPDFKMTGEMKLNIMGRDYPQSSSEAVSEDYTFDPSTELLTLKDQRRIMQFRFEANKAGTGWEMGMPILHLDKDAGRP